MKLWALLIVATMLLGGMLLSGVVLAKNIKGDGRNNNLTGTNGTDNIKGNGGADTIDGKKGADTISGGKGADRLRGGRSNDWIWGDSDYDIALGNQGNDNLFAEDPRQGPKGSLQAAKIKGGRKPDKLLGNQGKDTIRAQNGKRDIIRGGPGRDKAYVDRGVDSVQGVEVVLVTPPKNEPPVANNDCYDADNDDYLNVPNENATGLLSNDTDPDSGDTLKAVLVSGPSHDLSFTLNENGSFEYQATSADATPTPDSFTYKATDGAAKSNVATVNISFEGHAAIPTGGARAQC
jgi:VCBS repeat-containing protein